MDEHVYPGEARYFRESMELGPRAVWPVVEELKPRAREAGLWNMTEPAVASSDATNVESTIERDGDEYVISGRKWYITNAIDPRCAVVIFMGKTDPTNPDRHRQQSVIRVPNILLGEDRGFEIAQGRLGPGRPARLELGAVGRHSDAPPLAPNNICAPDWG